MFAIAHHLAVDENAHVPTDRPVFVEYIIPRGLVVGEHRGEHFANRFAGSFACFATDVALQVGSEDHAWHRGRRSSRFSEVI